MKPEALKIKALEMRDAGATYREIAEACGVEIKTAMRWTCPGYAEKKRLRDQRSANARSERFRQLLAEDRARIQEKLCELAST
jgi:hypothetical protein